MSQSNEITPIQIYKELNQRIRLRINNINDLITELYDERTRLEKVLLNNVDNIITLEGYDCILTSTDETVLVHDSEYCSTGQNDLETVGTVNNTISSKISKKKDATNTIKDRKIRKTTKTKRRNRKAKIKYYMVNQ